jgi:hypothetical protein
MLSSRKATARQGISLRFRPKRLNVTYFAFHL